METVNVIEVSDGLVVSLRSFPADSVTEAQSLFEKIAIENNAPAEYLEDIISDGFYSNNDWSVQLVHSNNFVE